MTRGALLRLSDGTALSGEATDEHLQHRGVVVFTTPELVIRAAQVPRATLEILVDDSDAGSPVVQHIVDAAKRDGWTVIATRLRSV